MAVLDPGPRELDDARSSPRRQRNRLEILQGTLTVVGVLLRARYEVVNLGARGGEFLGDRMADAPTALSASREDQFVSAVTGHATRREAAGAVIPTRLHTVRPALASVEARAESHKSSADGRKRPPLPSTVQPVV